jgi:nucleoside 2-deoxyribosyltransferase
LKISILKLKSFIKYYLSDKVTDLKVLVCGPIGYGELAKIRVIQSLLKEKGFVVLDHISNEHMDYSRIKDFRDKQDLAKRIVEHDLEFIKKGDVIVAIINRPSYGTAVEMFVAKKLGKKVISYSEKEVPTPWPIAFSDIVVRSYNELISALRDIEKNLAYRASN